jgi:hypothetical protein
MAIHRQKSSARIKRQTITKHVKKYQNNSKHITTNQRTWLYFFDAFVPMSRF